MGLLSLGTPLPWEEARKHADHVRKHGIIQFLNIWNRIKTRRKDHLLWGDEIEYVVVHYDEENKQPRVSLRAHDVLEKLQALEMDAIAKGEVFESSWKPEYGRYMLEGTPGLPYGYTLEDTLAVEESMRRRRELATSLLPPNEAVLTMTNFPLLGSCGFTEPSATATPDSGPSMSLFIPSEAINPHARFPTLTANIRERRGSKVSINMPIFKDKNTPSPWKEPAPSCLARSSTKSLSTAVAAGCSNGEVKATEQAAKSLDQEHLPSLPDLVPDALPDHIYMDAMCFGMGCCCLQVTFQACSVEEARLLYDQLAVVTPIMMALSAGAPIFRGYLADVDCRWNVISGSVDDRTVEERGLKPLDHSRFRIQKSRYDSISNYLSPGPNYSGGCSLSPDLAKIPVEQLSSIPSKGMEFYKDQYNDLNCPYDPKIYEQLREGGVDDLLAKHYAHLFIRDPLVVFKELLDQNDELSSDHFENIQSTNWQTMRFKPPPPSAPHIGWRVEFRSMEIQLTDTENAAFAVFVVLLVRAILSFDLNLYIPLSKVDENMQRAHSRDAVHREKFWFRRQVVGDPQRKLSELGCKCKGSTNQTVAQAIHGEGYVNGVANRDDPDAFDEMTLDEIMNGKPSTNFLGLVNLVRRYLKTHSEAIKEETRAKLDTYVDIVSRKASGDLQTGATWLRNFVTSHPEYKQDSVVSKKIAYDLCKAVEGLAGKKVKGLNC
ncbi:glutamate-cysteine ligase-domain-containing protein [Fimicolochytrium jonesii]|uniref:glutamate-cysteine ligase-domain-containing protein n=1 Tax=Fimicolochytrium jonesii TaxID=1396493 RepID=UPI0022FEFB1F|nr:glutamate-cysteine ligase-domain-containing protein [Fimicolochytrium jonesii]KAI8819320.1 glutamate-cysteine ligase-domain-containing protein [Fimicolochytrium jonesii]